MSAAPRYRILFILGLGRSGSTLLGSLLGSHPEVVNTGELLRLEEAITTPGAKCSCGLPMMECGDWWRLMEGIPEKVRRDYRKWTPALLDRVRENAGARMLVDVSKTRSYRLAKRWRHPEVGFILLTRDPRGIFRSYVEGGGDLKGRLRMHRKWLKRFATFARRHGGRCLVTRYEDLVSKPEETMRGLCDFIGLDYRPQLITPGAVPGHLAVYSGSSYMKGTGRLRLDERWREEIPAETLALISKELGKLELYQGRYDL
jgi:hypothetical protein